MSVPSTDREVLRVVQSHHQREGAGFVVRRPFPTLGIDSVDPFLLIDEMGPVDYGPGEAVGAPDHPHRGFETVTYVLEGEFQHEDSAGHRGVLKPGDVQWMTAGAGIIHSELPSEQIRKNGGRVHGFQIRVNLPREHKLTRPRYQEYSESKLPKAQSLDGKAQVRVIAGEALGAHAIIETRTPLFLQDWTLKPGADVTLPIPKEMQALVYLFEGSLQVGGGDTGSKEGQLLVLGPGDQVRLRGTDETSRFLVLAGIPLNEPIARHGPFVMNSRAEILQAVADYQSGKMGEITRSAEWVGSS